MTQRRKGWPRIACASFALWLAAGITLAACSPTDNVPVPSDEDVADVPEVAIPATAASSQDESPAPAGPSETEPATELPAEADNDESSDSGAQSEAPDGDGRSADMLSSAETRSAESLALDAASGMLAAATDRDALGAAADLGALADQPTYRVMYVQRYQTKEDEPRSAEVAFYRYDTNDVVLSKVNLEDESVSQLAVPPGYLPPLLPEEIAEAARIARNDEEVVAFLVDAGLDPETAVANGLLTTSVDAGGSACIEGRCVRLFFFDADHVVPQFTIVVDLTRVTVVEIAPMVSPEPQEEIAP